MLQSTVLLSTKLSRWALAKVNEIGAPSTSGMLCYANATHLANLIRKKYMDSLTSGGGLQDPRSTL